MKQISKLFFQSKTLFMSTQKKMLQTHLLNIFQKKHLLQPCTEWNEMKNQMKMQIFRNFSNNYDNLDPGRVNNLLLFSKSSVFKI